MFQIDIDSMNRYVSPINPAVFPHLTVVLLGIGIFFMAWFFVYPCLAVIMHVSPFVQLGCVACICTVCCFRDSGCHEIKCAAFGTVVVMK